MSHEALSPEQFAEHLQYQRLDESHYIYSEHHGASMEWDANTGDILGLGVAPAHRRQGVATAMYREAHRRAVQDPSIHPPRHSHARTEAGEAWAQSLGEDLPPRTEKL